MTPGPRDAARIARDRRRGEEAAARIRERMRRVPCSCVDPGELDDRGRCSRCYGWPAAPPTDAAPVAPDEADEEYPR